MSHIDHPFLAVPANQKQIGSPGIDRKLFMDDVKSGKYDDFTSFIFEEGWENLQNRQIPIPRKNCRDVKHAECSGFTSFFSVFGVQEGCETSVSQHFPLLFLPLQPQKRRGKQPIEKLSHPSCFWEGWERTRIRRFHILRLQRSDGKLTQALHYITGVKAAQAVKHL